MKASHKDAFPFVLLLLPYISGMFFCLYSPLHLLNNWPLWPLLVTALLFILLNLLYRKLKIYNRQWLGGLLAIIFLFTSGVTITYRFIEVNQPDHFSKIKATSLIVKAITEPVIKNGNIRFTARALQAVGKADNLLTVNGKLSITLSEKAAKNISYGDVLLIPANYKPVSPPLNPAEFNYRSYLAHKNIYHQVYLSPGKYITLNTGTGNPIIAYAQKLRKRLVDKFKVVIKDPDASAVASTLILGYSAELSNDVLQAYSKTGTIHVLSVSGAHVGLIYLVLAFLLAPLNNGVRSKLIVTLIIVTCIWGYALLTGFSPPVCRAGMMLSFILLGRCFARQISQLNILAVSAFITLLADPLLVTDVGFQLSYLAVAGLIVLQPLIYRKLIFKNKLADQLWLICSASIAAQLVTLPLSTYYFHQVPVYFLVSNLVILIPSAIIMYAGILYLLIPQGWLPGKWLGLLVEKLIVLTNKTLSVIEHAPWSTIDRVWLSNIQLWLALIIVILINYCLYKPYKVVLIALCTTIITLISIRLWQAYQIKNSYEIVFFSLRNDAAIALRSGNNVTLVTDIDTASKTYSYSIKPYIDSCGIYEIHLIDITSDTNTNSPIFNGHIINFNRKLIGISKTVNIIPDYKRCDYIYLNGKAAISDAVINNLNQNQTVIIAGKSNKYHKQDLVNRLSQKHIKYIVSGSNKALIVSSN